MALVTALRRLDTHDALESLRALRRRQPVTYWAFYSNVGFVTADGVFRHPKFDHILSGCTSLRVLDLARALVARGVITGVEVCDIPVTQARRAREMALIGSSVKVAPIVAWDDVPIGDGTPGPITAALRALLEEDMRAGDRLTDVPYARP